MEMSRHIFIQVPGAAFNIFAIQINLNAVDSVSFAYKALISSWLAIPNKLTSTIMPW
jgi:hypothetical protein